MPNEIITQKSREVEEQESEAEMLKIKWTVNINENRKSNNELLYERDRETEMKGF